MSRCDMVIAAIAHVAQEAQASMHCSDVATVVIVLAWRDARESDACHYEDDGSRHDVLAVHRSIRSYPRFQNVSRWR